MVIASTDHAFEPQEPGHPPVLYIPFDDIYFVHLERIESSTESPRKGTASYWRVRGQGDAADGAKWSYEDPKPDAAAIREHGEV
ncbi:DUF427 domain-containing protein [Phyllobacterium zundukense]|uniref:DUF427 domain-containing protein n=1 Tax=Phyllobacterium zundukense TaxID=1867719 RepID=UPI0012FFF551